MDTAQLITTILTAGGGGAALLALINGLIKWLSGAARRERERNTDLIAQRIKAVEEKEIAQKDRDEADKRRREAYEYASTLRSMMYENGITPPAWPESHRAPKKTITKSQ